MASLIRERERPRKPWRVDWSERGQRRTQRFATKTEAEAFIGDLAGGKQARQRERITVKAWVLRWLESQGPTWEPRTVLDRGDFADKWIIPYLGKMRLGEVDRQDVRDLRAWMRRRKATVYTANRAVEVLSAALGAAVDDGLLDSNPCRGLKKLPRDRVQRRRAASLAEAEAIRHYMTTDRDRAILSLLAYAGLRPSEVYSLRWEDVRDKTIVVRSAARDGGGEKATKTGSIRSIPLIPALTDDLEPLDRGGPHVIGPFDHRHWTSSPWKTARDKAGVPGGPEGVVPYGLRHTFASIYIASGLNAWQIAHLLGHSTPQMVIRTYGHLFAEAELAGPQPVAPAVEKARHAASAIRRAKADASPG